MLAPSRLADCAQVTAALAVHRGMHSDASDPTPLDPLTLSDLEQLAALVIADAAPRERSERDPVELEVDAMFATAVTAEQKRVLEANGDAKLLAAVAREMTASELNELGLHVVTAADMRVLEAMAEIHSSDIAEMLDEGGFSMGHANALRAELARREAKRG